MEQKYTHTSSLNNYTILYVAHRDKTAPMSEISKLS